MHHGREMPLPRPGGPSRPRSDGDARSLATGCYVHAGSSAGSYVLHGAQYDLCVYGAPRGGFHAQWQTNVSRKDIKENNDSLQTNERNEILVT